MLIVLAHHTASQGEDSSVLLLTNDPKKALRVARDAENLGYTFGQGDLVTVGSYCPEHAYKKGEPQPDTKKPIHGHLGTVYTRAFIDGKWREEWTDAGMQGKMFGVPAKAEAA